MAESVEMTDAQKQTLVKKWKIDSQDLTLDEFISSAVPMFHDDAIVVRWCGMWLCIETDGHCHT